MNKTTLLSVAAWILAIIGLVIFGFSTDADGAIATYVTYALILLVIAVVLAAAFSVINILKDPTLLKRVLMGVGILIVFLIISYFIAGDEAVYNTSGALLIESGATSKWVGTGIIYSMILLVIGGALFLWDMVKNVSK